MVGMYMHFTNLLCDSIIAQFIAVGCEVVSGHGCLVVSSLTAIYKYISISQSSLLLVLLSLV